MAAISELMKLLATGGLSGMAGSAIGMTGSKMLGNGVAPPAAGLDPSAVTQMQLDAMKGVPVPMATPAAAAAAYRNVTPQGEPMSGGGYGQDYPADMEDQDRATASIRERQGNDPRGSRVDTYQDQVNSDDGDNSTPPSTEQELDMIHRGMEPSDATDFSGAKRMGAWEGTNDGVPTKRDLAILDQTPTDGVINSFIKAFPTWADQNGIARDGKPLLTTGDDSDYAISDEEIKAANRNRRTRIDER